ncbi:MAG: F0F1 ATP synthase subunit delta [Ramlibacter sp.]|jgi:F-type H+-transporting ATPase subunit delta
MAELATIARPYADALFKSAQADLNAAAAWLEPLAAIAGNAQLQAFAANPKVTDQQVFDLIAGVAKTALPDNAKNFLRTVIENGRLEALPEIAAQFRALKNARSGSSDAVVHSAFPVDGAALADLSAVLEKRFGRKLNVSVVLDASLIGGIRVVVGDEVLDTSVKARLEQMKTALTA